MRLCNKTPSCNAILSRTCTKWFLLCLFFVLFVSVYVRWQTRGKDRVEVIFSFPLSYHVPPCYWGESFPNFKNNTTSWWRQVDGMHLICFLIANWRTGIGWNDTWGTDTVTQKMKKWTDWNVALDFTQQETFYVRFFKFLFPFEFLKKLRFGKKTVLFAHQWRGGDTTWQEKKEIYIWSKERFVNKIRATFNRNRARFR